MALGRDFCAGFIVDDIEVVQPAVPCTNGSCVDEEGSFSCACDEGFTPWDETICTDGTVDLTDYKVLLYQDAVGPASLVGWIDFDEVTEVDTYIVITRDADGATWLG
jgi:hypothetical protein